MALIDFKMEREEDIYKFVEYVTKYFPDVLHGYQDYHIILAGNVTIDKYPGYFLVMEDENIVLFTLSDDKTHFSHFIEKQFVDSAYKMEEGSITFKYNREKVFVLNGEVGTIVALFEFLNANETQKQLTSQLKESRKKTSPFVYLTISILTLVVAGLFFFFL